MPLIFKDDALLFRDGQLAMSEDCCCEEAIEASCEGNTFVFPQSVTVDMTGMATRRVTCSDFPGVTDCDAISGSHELAFISSGVASGLISAFYQLTAFGVIFDATISVPCISGNGRITLSVHKTGPTCGSGWSDLAIPWRLDWTGQTFTLSGGVGAAGPCLTGPTTVPFET
jgi:hypothetical protein